MNKINKKYLNFIGFRVNNSETNKESCYPILNDYDELHNNSMIITNYTSEFRNIHLDSLNNYFYYINNWFNSEYMRVPLSNLIRISFNALYPKLILGFYEIGLFQLIDKKDIERIRSFFDNKTELKQDLVKYKEEKTWLNNFIQSHYAYHDFKYVIDSYMYGLVMDLIEKTKNKVIMYNIDEIIIKAPKENDYLELLNEYFDYELETYERGIFETVRDYVLFNTDNVESFGNEKLCSKLHSIIIGDDLRTEKEKRIESLSSSGFITEKNKIFGNLITFQKDFILKFNSLGVKPTKKLESLEIKEILYYFSDILYKAGEIEDKFINIFINKLYKQMQTIEIIGLEIMDYSTNSLGFREEDGFKSGKNYYRDYYINNFNLLKFIKECKKELK